MAIITAGGVSLSVQVLDTTRTRRVSARIEESLPVSDDEWPISASEFEARAQAVFDRFARRALRRAAEWAVNKAGDALGDRYVARIVPSPAEAKNIASAARDEARDGLT